MIVALIVLGAVVAGVAAGVTGTLVWHYCQVDAHHYRTVAASNDRARAIAAQADHDHRYARRLEDRCRALRTANADLIRTIGVMARPRRAPRPAAARSAMVDYGIWAAAS